MAYKTSERQGSTPHQPDIFRRLYYPYTFTTEFNPELRTSASIMSTLGLCETALRFAFLSTYVCCVTGESHRENDQVISYKLIDIEYRDSCILNSRTGSKPVDADHEDPSNLG